MLSRGCPHNCSYCFNKGIRGLYSGKGSWLRFKSTVRIIEEIKYVKSKYTIKWISFSDDTFNASTGRLQELLTVYKKEINIPFVCQIRVDSTNEEQIELLKWAGVDRITIGIEHGDEEFRKRVLNRNYKNKDIERFGKWARERKIRVHTQNIVGFPEETLDMAFKTIEVNSILKPELAAINLLQPYPGTEIFDYVKDLGYLNDDFDFKKIIGHDGYYTHSKDNLTSKIKNEYMPQFINLRCFFMLLVWYPWLKEPVKFLIKLPYNRFYELIYMLTGRTRIFWRYSNWSERAIMAINISKRFFFRNLSESNSE